MKLQPVGNDLYIFIKLQRDENWTKSCKQKSRSRLTIKWNYIDREVFLHFILQSCRKSRRDLSEIFKKKTINISHEPLQIE